MNCRLHASTLPAFVACIALFALSAGVVVATTPAPSHKTTITVHLPCVIGGPMQQVVAAYETTHPQVEMLTDTYKPLGVKSTGAAAEVVVTVGDGEMQALVKSGAVAQKDIRAFAINTYRIVAIVPSRKAQGLTKLADLAKPSVRRIFIENPAQSSLGARVVQSMKDAGLWAKVGKRVIYPAAGSMILGELVSGKADAAVVIENCFLSKRGTAPKTIKILGALSQKRYPPIAFEAAALQGKNTDAARDFVQFLVSDKGRKALRSAGLTPPEK